MRSGATLSEHLSYMLLAGAGCIVCLIWGGSLAKKEAEMQQDRRVEQPAKYYEVDALVTAYCPCEKCCGEYADGVTAIGRDAKKTRGVAVDPRRIPYGTNVSIPGIPRPLMADDTGGAMRNAEGYHIDVRFPTHQEARDWGRQWLKIRLSDG